MASRNWADAVKAYAQVLDHYPGDAAIRVQYGHALKESGAMEEACAAYQAAIDAVPMEVDARFHLALLKRRLGREDEGLDDLAALLELDPDHAAAQRELIGAGGRRRMPHAVLRSAHRRGLVGIAALQDRLDRATRSWVDLTTYPLDNYADFRRDVPIAPPPQSDGAGGSLQVRIDARGAAPFFLRATIMSLIDQSDCDWTAFMLLDDDVAAHPVASIIAADDRFRPDPIDSAELVLSLSAGTILDRQAIAWFKFVRDRHRPAAIWCDYDHAVERWDQPREHEQPILSGVFDFSLIAGSAMTCPVILAPNPRHSGADGTDAPAAHRAALHRAAEQGAVAHIPRLLASILMMPPRAQIAPGDEDAPLWASVPDETFPKASAPISSNHALATDGTIDVIMPTRDCAPLLARAVETLLAKAGRRDRIRLTIADNRSERDETRDLLASLAQDHGARIVTVDEPFNWSRINNLLADQSTAETLVFANNDIEMLSADWDEVLLASLGHSDVGGVGAKLIYADGSLQHGGILFGLGEGSPVHDGAKTYPGDPGPQARYELTHAASAVTGAFLGVRRSRFRQVGGFDAVAFPVGYNDVDFCLKLRAAGLKILYVPAIEAIHHESKTRGLSDTKTRVAWDQGELRTLHQRWGDAMLIDPGYNPYWARDRAYDGFREPSIDEILRHIDIGSRVDPWLVSPSADDPAPR